MASIKVVLTDTELEHMLADIDVDGGSSIGLIEFEAVMPRIRVVRRTYVLCVCVTPVGLKIRWCL